MKRIIILILLVIPLLSFSQESSVKIKWHTFEEAIELQKETPKKLFIDVYTDWCGYCKKMDRNTFSNPVIAKYLNEHFYPVKFDAEQKGEIVFQGTTYTNKNKSRGSHELAQALLQGRMSYPSFAFLNEKAELITIVSGYYPAESFEPIIHFFGDDIFTQTKWEEFSKEFKSEL